MYNDRWFVIFFCYCLKKITLSIKNKISKSWLFSVWNKYEITINTLSPRRIYLHSESRKIRSIVKSVRSRAKIFPCLLRVNKMSRSHVLLRGYTFYDLVTDPALLCPCNGHHKTVNRTTPLVVRRKLHSLFAHPRRAHVRFCQYSTLQSSRIRPALISSVQ